MKNKINTDEANIAHYNKTGHLYGKKIECNCCDTLVTAFGSNLEGKIEKAGGIEKLLVTFICRSCKSEAKPKTEKKPSVKREKKDKEEIAYVVPKMKFSEKRNVFLKDAPDIIQAMTNFACASPAYYLDHSRSCNGCAYAAYCNCPLKKLAA
jgi:hypothetical protein